MKLALLFPGQGAQYEGMGKELYEKHDWVKNIYQKVADRFSLDLYKLCFESDLEYLTRTDHAQAAIFVVSYINYLNFLQEYEIKPEYMAGHSLGEFTAFAASEALSFEDALGLVIERGRLMQAESEKSQGGMLAVKWDYENVDKMCRKMMKHHNCSISISNYNSINQIVLSGDEDSLNTAEKIFEANEILTTRLNVSAAFHSGFMETAACEFSFLLSEVNFSVPECGIISNVSGLPYNDDFYRLLSRQMVSAVRWYESLQFLEKEGVDIYVDMGPKSILKGIMKRSLRKGKVYSFEEEEDKILLDKILSEQEGL
ncbi:ACP S-malonyltransferase [Lachnospiraceae bacterium 54-53]